MYARFSLQAQPVRPQCRSIVTSLTGRHTGFVGVQLTQLLLKELPDVKLITTDIVQPPALIEDTKRLRCVKSDLGDKAQVEALFEGEEIGGVFALQ
jgi:nucleoside-diphosphate-sugar epimerase